MDRLLHAAVTRESYDSVLVARAERTVVRDFAYFASTFLFSVLGLRLVLLVNFGA